MTRDCETMTCDNDNDSLNKSNTTERNVKAVIVIVNGHSQKSLVVQLIGLIFIARLLDEDTIVLVAIFGVLALDGRVLLSRFLGLGGVQVAVHILHEQLMVELLPHLGHLGGLVA